MKSIVYKRRKKLEAQENCLVKRRKKLEAQDNCLVEDDAVQVLLLDDLPESCIYNIFIRLPLESLCILRLVCKSWYGIVNNTNLPDTRGIIFSTPVQNYSPRPSKVFSAVTNSTITDPRSSKFHIKFMEFNKGGKSRIKEYNSAFRGRITGTCDGLIVLEKDFRTRGLILLNKVTRELEHIPHGTISSVPGGNLYGLAAFSHASSSSRRHKLLHLFMKGEFSNLLGCEIMDIGSGSWRAVDVPPTERFHLLHSLVFAMGALHWIQNVVGQDVVECMVSMPLDDEKFKTTPIPSAKTGLVQFNTVFAMGEFLGFSSRRAKSNQIGVWILKGTDDECGWEEQYNIDASVMIG